MWRWKGKRAPEASCPVVLWRDDEGIEVCFHYINRHNGEENTYTLCWNSRLLGSHASILFSLKLPIPLFPISLS